MIMCERFDVKKKEKMKWKMEIGTGQRRKGKKFQRREKTWNKRRLLKVMVLLHLMTRLFFFVEKIEVFSYWTT